MYFCLLFTIYLNRIIMIRFYPFFALMTTFCVFLLLFWACEKDNEEAKLPNMETIEVSEIGHDGAKSGGNVVFDGGSKVTQRGVVWATDTNPTLDQHTGMTHEGEGAGVFASYITNLDPETKYYYRAYGTNIAGTAYGEKMSFTTLLHPETVRVEGFAYYAKTKIPIEGVKIEIGDKSTVTGSDGYYIFEDIHTGVRAIRATKEGYLTFLSNIFIQYGINEYNVDMSSNQYTHKVYGYVESVPSGEPAGNATVLLMNPDGTESKLKTSTSPDGQYELGAVPRGNMTIRFKASDYQNQNKDIYISDSDQQLNAQIHFLYPIVTTGEITDVYASIAFGGGEVIYEGTAPVFARGLVWNQDTIPLLMFDLHSQDGGGPGPFFSQLFGLMPQSPAIVRAYARNVHGTAYGDTLVLHTERDTGRPCPDMETFTDPRDGTTYNTVQIGDQCWLKENMSYLPEVHKPIDESVVLPRYYVYGYFGENVDAAKATEFFEAYGVLYNWPAAMQACPPGWRLPDNNDWGQLPHYLAWGYPELTLFTAAATLKSCRQIHSPLGGDCNTTTHPRWDSHDYFYGTDEFGFAAFPGGRKHSGGYFTDLGIGAFWWTSTEVSGTMARRRSIHNYLEFVAGYQYHKSHGYSVRCVRGE